MTLDDDLFHKYGIVTEYGCGFHNGRNIRYLQDRQSFQVGTKDFDRWANSVELEFDLGRPPEERAFRKWLAEVKSDE